MLNAALHEYWYSRDFSATSKLLVPVIMFVMPKVAYHEDDICNRPPPAHLQDRSKCPRLRRLRGRSNIKDAR